MAGLLRWPTVSTIPLLLRPNQQRRRDRETEGLSGLWGDDKLERRSLLDGQVRWLKCADFCSVTCGARRSGTRGIRRTSSGRRERHRRQDGQHISALSNRPG